VPEPKVGRKLIEAKKQSSSTDATTALASKKSDRCKTMLLAKGMGRGGMGTRTGSSEETNSWMMVQSYRSKGVIEADNTGGPRPKVGGTF
jgi:hypothetical protein